MSEQYQEELPVTRSAGEQLRAARRITGLDIAHFAEKLHLPPGYLDALEKDQLELLPSRVFALGYLRKYARLLNLDADALIQQEMQTAPHPTDAIQTLAQPKAGNFVIRSKPAASGAIFIIGGVLLVAALVLAYVWWESQQVVDSATDTSVVVMPLDNRQLESMPTFEDLSMEQETDLPLMGPLWLDDDELALLQGADAIEALADQDDAVVETDADVASVADAVPASGLLLRFSDNCWIDVRDARGRIVRQGLMRAGQSIELPFDASLSLVLGNAKAATLYIDGELFDLPATTANNVARFTVTPGTNE